MIRICFVSLLWVEDPTVRAPGTCFAPGGARTCNPVIGSHRECRSADSGTAYLLLLYVKRLALLLQPGKRRPGLSFIGRCAPRRTARETATSLPSKNPADAPEKTPSWPKLGSKDPYPGPVAQFIALIKKVSHIKPELESSIFLGQMKRMGESYVDRVISR